MNLKVLLPTRVLIEEEVAKVTAEAENGSFTLLPRHIDFVTFLPPGLLSYVDEELLEYLPQKPEPVDWAALPLEKKNEVMEIFNECREQGLTKKTIKKKIRKALES